MALSTAKKIEVLERRIGIVETNMYENELTIKAFTAYGEQNEVLVKKTKSDAKHQGITLKTFQKELDALKKIRTKEEQEEAKTEEA